MMTFFITALNTVCILTGNKDRKKLKKTINRKKTEKKESREREKKNERKQE